MIIPFSLAINRPIFLSFDIFLQIFISILRFLALLTFQKVITMDFLGIFDIFMYMKGSNYFEERNIASTIKLREKLSVLPYFCREFYWYRDEDIHSHKT